MASAYTALYRYSHWDGSRRKRRSADDLMGALSDDFLESGSIEQALRSLMRRGISVSPDQRISGIHDMIRKLREQQRKQLQRYNLDSVFDDIKAKLSDILDMENQTIDDWLAGRTGEQGTPDGNEQSADGGEENTRQPGSSGSSGSEDDESGASGEGGGSTEAGSQQPGGNFSSNVLKSIAERSRRELERLPEDFSSQIKALQDYNFLNADAQKEFLKLMQQLRDAMTNTFFKDITDMVKAMSEGDMSRMKDMLKALNDMLVKHIAGDDPGFEQFMAKFGDMFGDNPPQSLEELLAQMEAQMAATQSMLNSMSPDQRRQLESLLEGKLGGDRELQQELMKLSKELSFLNPQADQHRFSGEEAIDFQSAMKLMEELQRLENLEKQFHDVNNIGDLDKIDEGLVKELLGEEGADDFNELKDILETLEKAGYVRKDGKGWEMTPRGSRIIGHKALEEIYRKLKHANLGGHRSISEGRFGDQQEDSKPYEYGDSLRLHIPRTLKNAIRRESSDQSATSRRGRGERKVNLHPDDFEIHRHELNTKTATVLLLDLSWSMAMRDAFLPAKKVALALHHLISSSYSRDTLEIIGFSAYAKEIKARELTTVDVDQFTMGTNMHHALILAQKKLARVHGGTKQIIMISDGEPTAHLEDGYPYFEYPPSPVTIAKTLLEVKRCTQKNITLNTFMLDQSPFLRSFMNKIAKMNGGRVFYTTPYRLGEYILHDYVANKRKRVA